MKLQTILLIFFCMSFFSILSQEKENFTFETSKENPFGKYNPEAPKQLLDYKDLIGECNCISESRNPDGTWAKPTKMIWSWKYIMNGTAVQDETLKEDGIHSGSIRQYNKDSLHWNVHYYSSANISSTLSVWNGNKNKEGKIVLYKKQKAPNGAEGFSRLTFYDIDKKGYKWIGEWVDKSEKIVFPFWKISCVK
ncbi:hypothetical protein H9W90_03265 [Polaribacter pectinis]|uniref:Uncharacterized protein n=1 Tax=Polaribacter pectinis TaxID=2738844 RepID=A0A7G9LC02_9FLAO|nr:hypothetical protein [Polaribacter pectinis]QNM86151.1 hypothetical protein H9W90_03265 [Polaribacter pectinis]